MTSKLIPSAGLSIPIPIRRSGFARFLLWMMLTLPVAVQAQFKYLIDKGTITITEGNCLGGAVAIPNTIDGLPVTSIGSVAFSGCNSISSVTIPNSVTSIGEGAFTGCTNLTSVSIPNSVTSIGYQAFFGCTRLTSVTIPDSVTRIESGAFASCPALSGIAVEALNSSYCSVDGVLFDQGKTTLIQYPGGKAGNYITPDSVRSIRDFAFYDCTSLTSVTLPPSVRSIGASAFSGCTELTSVIIPNGVTSIGSYAFFGCASLTGVMIPTTVRSIGDFAFYRCTGLGAITVEALNSVYSSVDGVLFNKGQSTLIQYPVGKTGGYAIHNSITRIGDGAFSGPGLTEITIPNSVTSIGGFAFSGCTGLSSVTIPNSVRMIPHHAFSDCTSLTNLTIPSSVTSIGSFAFSGCTSLSSVTIPNSVFQIGSFAFDRCTSLTSVTIPNSVTSIGRYAFSGCTSLSSVTIPNSVTSIGGFAFSGCTGLTGLYFNGNTPSLPDGEVVFASSNNVIVYYFPETTGWDWMFSGRPAVLWNPQVLTSDGSFGVRDGHFGFTIIGASGLVVVVEASTELANPDWTPVETSTLLEGSSYFSDSQWTNYPSRFYRLRSP